jgi:RluA family pseudouridine synthase
MAADQTHVLSVEAGEGGRLDRFVATRLAELSRTTVQRLVYDGFITLDGSPCRASDKVGQGDVIVVRIPPPAPTELVAEDIPLAIVYEDDDVVVIDKPAGLVVHPAAGHDRGTLVNALLGHIPDLEGIGGEVRPGIVHRLDKDTSGLIIAAKNDRALQLLQAQFKARTIKKMYLALVEAWSSRAKGSSDAPIGRKSDRKKMAVTREGRSARTLPCNTVIAGLNSALRSKASRLTPPEAWAPRAPRADLLSLVEACPETGRTHQIRVPSRGSSIHWWAMSCTGGTCRSCPSSALSACGLLTCTLPNGETRTFTSPLPDDLQRSGSVDSGGKAGKSSRTDVLLHCFAGRYASGESSGRNGGQR